MPLLVAGIKDFRAVLGAFIGALTVQFRRIVSHRKIDFQQLTEGNYRRIESHLNGLRGTRGAGAYNLIVRVGPSAARRAREGVGNPFESVEDGLFSQKHPPAKTTVSDFFSDRFSSTAGPGRLAAPAVRTAIKPIRPAPRRKCTI